MSEELILDSELDDVEWLRDPAVERAFAASQTAARWAAYGLGAVGLIGAGTLLWALADFTGDWDVYYDIAVAAVAVALLLAWGVATVNLWRFAGAGHVSASQAAASGSLLAQRLHYLKRAFYGALGFVGGVLLSAIVLSL